MIPNTLFKNELLSFTVAQKKMLIENGLQGIDLSGEQIKTSGSLYRLLCTIRDAPTFRFSGRTVRAFVHRYGQEPRGSPTNGNDSLSAS